MVHRIHDLLKGLMPTENVYYVVSLTKALYRRMRNNTHKLPQTATQVSGSGRVAQRKLAVGMWTTCISYIHS